MFIFRFFSSLYRQRFIVGKKASAEDRIRRLQMIQEAIRLHKQTSREHFLARGGYKHMREGEKNTLVTWQLKILAQHPDARPYNKVRSVSELLKVKKEIERKEFIRNGGFKHMRKNESWQNKMVHKRYDSFTERVVEETKEQAGMRAV